MVHEQMIDYIETKNILDPYQSGCRRGFSMHTLLVKVLDDIRRANCYYYGTFLSSVKLLIWFPILFYFKN